MSDEQRCDSKMDLAAIMEVYKNLAVPGAPHKLLAGRTGRWSTRNRHWMDLDKPPTESTGRCERKMILGGRYLQEELSGEMLGSPFSGIGLTGFDNNSKKFVMTWMDTLSTGIYFFEGAAGEDGRTITLESHFEDPCKGPMKLRGIIRLVDDNTEVSEMHVTDQDGREERCETTYTRER